jgi:arylsulfatase
LPPINPKMPRPIVAYDGGNRGAGGKGTLLVNSRKIPEGRIEKTIPNVISVAETANVGVDEETPVTEDYKVPFRFTGTLKRLAIELK